MKSEKVFLEATWSNLIHITYHVEEKILIPLIPPEVQLDYINDKSVVSLVIFEFHNTRIKGIPVPLYGDFCEMNLRFYVKDKKNIYKGVVFIRELIPRYLMAKAANILYFEKYKFMKIKSDIRKLPKDYNFNYKVDKKYDLKVKTEQAAITPSENSIKHVIKQRNAGFGMHDRRTIIYKVEHDVWEIHPVIEYTNDIDYGNVFGEKWSFLNKADPMDVTVAKGSDAKIYNWKFFTDSKK